MKSSRTNLTLQLTSFVGRERQLADLRQLLPEVRLLTLTGVGGVGKTRLALQLASDLTDSVTDGVWLVELAALQEPRLLSEAVAATFEVRQEPGTPLQLTLQLALHDRELLLVLDNCEHLVSACAALVSDLLRACPGVRILATSREPLGVVGETTWRVPSLTLVDTSANSGVDEIAACEAVRLFVERSRLVEPGFTLTDRNAATVAQICRRLDGIPLAIELAAARSNAIGLQQILARLDDRFGLLKVDVAGRPERQRTLRATVEWSHEMLSPVERMLFRRLSVFNGGWSLEAAEAVCSGDGLEPDDILDALAKLVDRSLVLVEGRETVARYTLLETLRQYAHEKLSDAGEETTLRHRHLAWCVSLAEQAAPRLKTADQTAWLHVLEREQDNFRSALSWSLQIGRVELCLRLLVASAYFFEIRGHRYRAEGLRWLEQAVSHPKAGTGPISLRAEALYWAGTYAGELCQFSSATRLLEKSLSLWQEIGDLRGMAEALLSVGVAARVRGDYERASTALDKAFGLMQERSDELGIAQAQRQRGILARVLGQFEIAESQTVEALHIFERLGELHQVGHAEAELGEVARAKGARERAAELLTLGAGLLAEAGCEEGVSAARYVQACLAHDEGNAAVAWARAVEALRVARDGGARRDTPRCLELLALLSVATDPRRSASLLGAADSVRTAFGIALHPIDQAIYDRAIADARGRLSEASFAEAWNAGCAMGTPPGDVFTYALETPVQAVASLQKRAPGDLTPRECEVAALVSRGFSNRQIAEALVITERTAEAHVTHILDKLGLRSRAQLAVWAVERNLS